MNSYQIVWRAYTANCGPMAGSLFVRNLPPAKAKKLVEQTLRADISNLTKLEIGRAYRKDAPHDDMYIN